jgi:site-specific DNA-adenine methylase
MLDHRELSKHIEWYNEDFRGFLRKLPKTVAKSGHNMKDVVVYLDAPYQYCNAVYQGSLGAWTLDDDNDLLNAVLKLRELGAKVVMSNVLHNKGVTSHFLIDWCEKHKDDFEVIHLDRDYGGCSSFQYEDGSTDEVLIISR